MKPILLHYYVTNRCNAKCKFCNIWSSKPKADAVTDDVFSNLIHARKAGCKFVDFTGGEPLLHPDLPLFLRKARELGYITSVTTNTLLFPERAGELAGLVDLLHFSIDADNAQLNDSIRGSGSYNSVMQSIPIALDNKLIPDLLFSYSDENIDSFIAIYEYCRKKKLMIILDPIFNTEGTDIVSRNSHKKAEKYGKLPGVYINGAHVLLRKQGGNNIKKSYCRAVSSTIVILADNTLALPCYHHRIYSLEIKTSLSDILDHPERIAVMRKQGTYLFCKGCHINCYFDPSYSFLFNVLYLKSMYAKLSYCFRKYIIYKRPAPRLY